MANLATTQTVKANVKLLTGLGCQVKDGSVSSGHLRVYEDDKEVYTALQKGKGGPWIVRCQDGNIIRWESRK